MLETLTGYLLVLTPAAPHLKHSHLRDRTSKFKTSTLHFHAQDVVDLACGKAWIRCPCTRRTRLC